MKLPFKLSALLFAFAATVAQATYQPTITVGSSALPTGAATAANQVSGGPQTGSGTVSATTQRVTLATDGLEVTNSTAIKNSVAAIPAKGAAVTANSTPVNIASDQIVPTSAAQLPAALGQTTAAASLPVVIASDDFIPVSASSPIISGPPSAQSIAATGTIQFSVQGGTVVALTLTNAPAATASWVGTVGFQWSANGSTWNTLNATPRSTLPGAGAVQASSTTAPGLWLASLPVNAAFVRYNVSAWTSGTIWGFVEAWNQTNGIIQLPWTPTVTSGQTLAGWFDASGINSLLIRFSAVTTTVVTVQGTNDPTGTDVDTINVQDTKTANASGASTITAANTFRALLVGHKWVRVQVTTTGTVLTVQGISATLGQIVGLSASGNSLLAISTGTVAQGSTATGNPVFFGGIAKAAQPTARSDGQMVAPLFGRAGHLIIRQGQIRELVDFNAQFTISNTTETTVVAALAATFNDLQSIDIAGTITFSGAPTEAYLVLRDVAAGTVRWSYAIPVAGGTFNYARNWMGSELKQTTVNTAWTAQIVFVGGTSPAVSAGGVRVMCQTVRNP